MMEFCGANGMGWMMRNAANLMDFGRGKESETITITDTEDNFKARFVTAEGYKNPDFTVRVPGESKKKSSNQKVETAAGDEYMMKVWKDDDNERLYMQGDGIKFTRYINNKGEMVLELEHIEAGVIAKRTHKKV